MDNEPEFRPECRLVGEDGNVFNLLQIVRKTLRQHELYAELETFDCEIADLQKEGGSYDDILCLITRYVDVV